MLQDFERDRPPEIDGLLTAVQAFARAAGIATPNLYAITALVIEKARRMGPHPPEVAALFWTKNRAALDGELLQRNGDNANAKE